jgi:hypothetical protein
MSEQNLNRDVLSQAPPLHEEPIEGFQPGKEICEICGKAFRTHAELVRHLENAHGNPEKTHTKPHLE